MRIVICDDDETITIQLKNYVLEFFRERKLDEPEIYCCDSGEALLADRGSRDIVFLDVEMPGINGITAGRKLKEQDQNTIIFIVTSHVEYLDDAMRFHVFRYLSKPVDKRRLFHNMKDALRLYNSSSARVPIETNDGISSCRSSDIIFIESMRHTITVHTMSGDFITRQNMEYWRDTLDMPCFFQTHRSYIINMKYVTDFDHSLVHLQDDRYTAYLTKRKYSEFKNAYFLYLESTR